MKKILWISLCMPYDTVPHAGGKTHNYYLKKLHNEKTFDIQVITFTRTVGEDKNDMNKYGISNIVIKYPKQNSIVDFVRKIIDLEAFINIWNRNGCLTSNYDEYKILDNVKKLAEKGYKPDVIILEWTQMVLLASKIKKIFPDAKYCGMEEDVAFLGYERKYQSQKNYLMKCFYRKKYKQLKKKEIEVLSSLDQIIVNNKKDYDLLVNINARNTKITTSAPYFSNNENINYKATGNYIIFWGAMGREENWRSAVWFIEKVMPLLKDLGVGFSVIGNNPSIELRKYEGENIKILGFVEDITELFENSLCMVVPLVLGAGIKVKVLEGLSAGVPVLANDIAVEGIEINANVDYLHCEAPEEYAQNIRRLFADRDLAKAIGNSGRKVIGESYNLPEEVRKYADILKSL